MSSFSSSSSASSRQGTHTITVIKRSGKDGPKFHLTKNQCKIGSSSYCDIRIQLPHVGDIHTTLHVDENQVVWCQTSAPHIYTNIISVPSHDNDDTTTAKKHTNTPIQLLLTDAAIQLNDNDIFQIADRQFRISYNILPTTAHTDTKNQNKSSCSSTSISSSASNHHTTATTVPLNKTTNTLPSLVQQNNKYTVH